MPDEVVVGEVEAHGIVSVLVLAAVQIHRQRDARMRDRVEVGHGFDRVADQFVDGNAFVGDAVDEAGVRAVFQQAAHEVGQQVLVRTDRCVHAAGHVEAIRRDHFRVQVVAHAVQLLELEVAAAAHPARQAVHGGDGLRVVGGEHRVDRVAGIEQAARIREV